ncbi:TrmH family RNA methyltransferase [Pseudalkalibacillus decolorationis]|uniref:TrmH family RNA methyltransferase n=1 Tax=Pseudalkalibacillus decolorationis TaxID=163879 RepID=UPI0021498650|nr:RNA methyltransferase [Pseudalkalibacillus decolorationis]
MNRITSPKNGRVKEWKKLNSKKGREKANAYLIEGPHLVEEALLHHAAISNLITDESFRIPTNWHTGDITTWVVTSSVIKELSDTESPQGVIAIVEIEKKPFEINPQGTYLLIDGIQDPGNLGTIIRTADSAGVDGIILGPGTVDLHNSKVLRSTQGSLFHIAVITDQLEKWIDRFQREDVIVYGTSLQGGVPYTNENIPHGFALLLGNEANGVTTELLKKTNKNLFVPIYGKAESLNVAVAAGILLYGLKQN